MTEKNGSKTIEMLKKIQLEEKDRRQVLGISDKVLEHLSTTIVCFFADGSEEFTAMTTVALRSFLFHTPNIAAGLLTHDRQTRDRVLSALPPEHLSRVVARLTSPHGHLDGPWNATKFKLDLLQFVSESAHFTIVVWLDSDTLVFNDMTPFISHFIKQQDKDYYLVRDLAMNDPAFVNRWQRIMPNIVDVPQACLMAFKRPAMHALFAAWRDAWNEWIYPTPFSRLPDPTGGQPHSAFCTEQYALGLALTRLGGKAALAYTNMYWRAANLDFVDARAAGWRVAWFARGVLPVRPTVQAARPVLSRSYNLPANFATRVAQRWHSQSLLRSPQAAAALSQQQQQALQQQQTKELHADAASEVRFRAGAFAGSSYQSSYMSSYLTSYQTSYTADSSYGTGTRYGAVIQPHIAVRGLAVESTTPLNTSSSSSSVSLSSSTTSVSNASLAGFDTSSAFASPTVTSISGTAFAQPQQAAPAAPDNSNNVMVNVDVFGGCVYHCYSQWFFYVLQELATPIVVRQNN